MEGHRIPAHIENGAICLDAPLPPSAERVEVVVYTPPTTKKKSLAEYVRSLPPGTMSGDEIDAELSDLRNWDR